MFQWDPDSKHSYCQAQWCHFVTSVLFCMNKQQLQYTFSLMAELYTIRFTLTMCIMSLPFPEQMRTLALTVIVHTNEKEGPPTPSFTCSVHHGGCMVNKYPSYVLNLSFSSFPARPLNLKKGPLWWTWLQQTFLSHMPVPTLWSAPSRERIG